MNETKVLKERGNTAYKEKNYEEAIELFKQAATVEEASPAKDPKLIAILHSNVAQAYLELKNYEQAIVAATLSLSHDPSFLKSVLRRATAKIELEKFAEAAVDLRHFLKFEPKLSKAIEMMRKIVEPTPMTDLMRFSFIGHRLCRALSKIDYSPSRLGVSQFKFRQSLINVTFVSSHMSCATKYFWSNGFLRTTFNERVFAYSFCPWIFNKSVNPGNYDLGFGLFVSKIDVETIFAVVQPSNVSLMIAEENPRIPEICCMYDFDKTLYTVNSIKLAMSPTEELIDNFQRVSKHLNIIPHFEGIERLEDTTFPKIDTLLFLEGNNISLDFLKLWEQHQWSVTTIVIEKCSQVNLDYRLFGRLSSNVREKVKSIQYIFRGEYTLTAIGDLSIAYRDLAALKRAFPSTCEFVGSFLSFLDQPEAQLDFFSRGLKAHVRSLLTDIDAEKIRIFKKPKILSCIKFKSTSSKIVKSSLEKVKRAIEELRRELPQIESISLSNAKEMHFWPTFGIPYAVIDIKAKGIEFQVGLFALSI